MNRYAFLSLRSAALGFMAAALGGLVLCAPAGAQEYPNKPISLVVPFPPGGSTDVQARIVAKGMTSALGKAVVVENLPGAAGAIGSRRVARASPDGYTLLFASISSLVTEPVLHENVGFDPLRNFTPVSIVSDMPFLLVVECSSPYKTVADLVNAAAKRPGKLNYASWGYGSSGNLLAEMFKRAAKVDITHIPYKGEAPAVTGLLSKEVSTMFVTPVNMPHIRAGKMCPLAVTGDKRLAMLPNTPTFDEIGIKGVDLQIWFGVVAPANTPAKITSRLQEVVAKVVKTKEFIAAAEPLGVVGIGSSSGDFTKRIEADIKSISSLAEAGTLRQ